MSISQNIAQLLNNVITSKALYLSLALFLKLIS